MESGGILKVWIQLAIIDEYEKMTNERSQQRGGAGPCASHLLAAILYCLTQGNPSWHRRLKSQDGKCTLMLKNISTFTFSPVAWLLWRKLCQTLKNSAQPFKKSMSGFDPAEL